jgi:hypothetical protein
MRFLECFTAGLVRLLTIAVLIAALVVAVQLMQHKCPTCTG